MFPFPCRSCQKVSLCGWQNRDKGRCLIAYINSCQSFHEGLVTTCTWVTKHFPGSQEPCYVLKKVDLDVIQKLWVRRLPRMTAAYRTWCYRREPLFGTLSCTTGRTRQFILLQLVWSVFARRTSRERRQLGRTAGIRRSPLAALFFWLFGSGWMLGLLGCKQKWRSGSRKDGNKALSRGLRTSEWDGAIVCFSTLII